MGAGAMLLALSAGCVPYDEYYAESTSLSGINPMYDMSGDAVGTYYQSSYQVRGNWPSYSRPYVQRQYYYYYTW